MDGQTTQQESSQKQTDQLKSSDFVHSRSDLHRGEQDVQEAMNLPMGSDDAQSMNPLQLTNEQQSRALQSTNQQNLGCYGMVGSTKGYLTSSDDRIYSNSDLQNTHNNLLFN